MCTQPLTRVCTGFIGCRARAESCEKMYAEEREN